MKTTYSSTKDTSHEIDRLSEYREFVASVVEGNDFSKNESSLATPADELMKEGVASIVAKLGDVTNVLLIGIGGSSLGTEAIQAALKAGKRLYVLDGIAPHRVHEILEVLKDIPKNDIAVCSISKSGGTTETLTNTTVFLEEFKKCTGTDLSDRTVLIGNPGNPLLQAGEAQGMLTLPMHEVIGGRYSVFTAVGLVPLALLGYSVDELLTGLAKASQDEAELTAAEGAARLYQEMTQGMHTLNFFAFDIRLEKLGRWYRQLSAESLGKSTTVEGVPVEMGFVPTISTPVELHSIGQLFFSGLKGVFTDFVRFDELQFDYMIPDSPLALDSIRGKTMQQTHEAICGGVLGAYGERNLPYRITELKRGSAEDIGLFMGIRMLETMYLAKLMNVNAFNQPNVELYKDITRDILSKE